ncbi:MAG: ABC transporter permease subunit [Firmicutes bacterium]|nr:ABC transporter permease subunit [Bacillota bacterium]MCL1953896.1 ABC transporter permease subunit [Bacillota bacterium]
MKKNHFLKILSKTTIILFWLLLWQVIALTISNNLVLPSPLSVLHSLLNLSKTQEFWLSIFNSFYKIVLGFFIACIVSTIIAILAYKIDIIKQFVAPIISALRAIPVASFIILLLIALSNKSNLSTIIVVIMVFPIVYANILLGLNSIDKNIIEMATVFNISRPKKLLYIQVHHILPYFSTSCKISIGLAFKSGIAAELIGVVKDSIGNQLQISKLYLMMDNVFAWTVIIVLLSVSFEYVVLFSINAFKKQIEN